MSNPESDTRSESGHEPHKQDACAYVMRLTGLGIGTFLDVCGDTREQHARLSETPYIDDHTFTEPVYKPESPPTEACEHPDDAVELLETYGKICRACGAKTISHVDLKIIDGVECDCWDGHWGEPYRSPGDALEKVKEGHAIWEARALAAEKELADYKAKVGALIGKLRQDQDIAHDLHNEKASAVYEAVADELAAIRKGTTG